jgi:hypothetical protein
VEGNLAKSSSPSCSAWKSVAPTAVSVSDDGDILQPLKRVRDKYIAKADELKEKAYGVNRVKILEAAESYTRMADSVGRLIGLIDAQHEASVSVVRDALDKAVGEHDNTQA